MLFIIALVCLTFISFDCRAGLDISDVNIDGDSTLMNMKIESSYFEDGAFLIETTGARFEYVKGQMKLYQGLDPANRRLLSSITFENEPNFLKVNSNNDHITFESQNLDIGIYGDSTLIVSPKIKQVLKFNGYFKPDYEGRYKGELLLIDGKGGMEIYPQRYESGYKVNEIELGKTNWTASYELNAGERVMIAAFPDRKFDWEKSFNCNVAMTCGSVGLGTGSFYGQLAPKEVIKRWSENFHIIVVFPQGVYTKYRMGSPYVVENEQEMRRFVNDSHDVKMKVTLYSSFFYYAREHGNLSGYFEEVKALKDKFGIDGIYIDGPTFDEGSKKIDDKIANWAMIRKLRQLFGANGVIVLHDTQLGSPVGTAPNVDAYCDVTLNGEGVKFNSVKDPYVQYQVRKYGISNTVGIWDMGPHPSYIRYQDAIDELIRFNGRERWGFFVPTKKAPPGNKYVWPAKLGNFNYYLQKLEGLKREYRSGKFKTDGN